jgi:hypothetical protein
MGTNLTHNTKDLLILLAVTFATLTAYSCQTQPVNNANQNPTAEKSTPTPLQLVIPPWPAGFPKDMPTPTITGNIPLTVQVGNVNSPEAARPFFDNFSWESFIALNWPAATSSRGIPEQPNNSNVFLNAASGAPVVWGSYKDSFDLFGQRDQRPSSWNSPASPISPCPNAQAGQKMLIFITKGDTPLMETKQAFSAPLIDQHGNYVYYDIRYDEAEYNFIRGQDSNPTSWLYLLKNLAPAENQKVPLQMPMSTTTPASVLGSIMVKAAWRIKTDKDDPKRFYTTTALILNPQTRQCTQTPILLVGFHVGHKVSPFTAWIWSTFEQVDNVPPDADVTPKPVAPPNGYSFNNGTDDPRTTNGFSYKPSVSPTPCPSPGDPSKPCPTPVQVTRVNPIPNTPQGASTRDVNAFYQQLLRGTVWQYYQLAVTQWPSNPGLNNFVLMQNGGIYPRDSGQAFPANGAVNTTQETYFQTQNDAAGAGGNSCMSCHYRAGQSDFSWGLNRRAH